MVKFYKRWVSPFFHVFFKMLSGNPYVGCRFEPTCSVYADQAIHAHGLVKGGWMAITRVCRCHPFSGRGGFDPI